MLDRDEVEQRLFKRMIETLELELGRKASEQELAFFAAMISGKSDQLHDYLDFLDTVIADVVTDNIKECPTEAF